MGFLNRFTRKSALASADDVVQILNEGLHQMDMSFQFGGMSDTQFTQDLSNANAKQLGTTEQWIQQYNVNPRLAGVGKIATDNGSTDFSIRRHTEKGEVKVINHPLERILSNHVIPPFFELWTAIRLMAGETYVALGRDSKGNINDIKLFAPQHIQEQTPTEYKFKFKGSQLTYKKSDVVKDLALDLSDPYGSGYGKVASGARDAQLDSAIIAYLGGFYANSTNPSMIISPRLKEGVTPPTDKDLKALVNNLNTYHRGATNAGKTAVLGFEADIVTVAKNHREYELLDTRKQLGQDMTRLLGIPPEIMGNIENSNKATVVAARTIYAEQVRKPILTQFENFLTHVILPLFTVHSGMFFQFDGVSVEDVEMDEKRAQVLVSTGVGLVDEVREVLGYPALKNNLGKVLVGTFAYQLTEEQAKNAGLSYIGASIEKSSKDNKALDDPQIEDDVEARREREEEEATVTPLNKPETVASLVTLIVEAENVEEILPTLDYEEAETKLLGQMKDYDTLDSDAVVITLAEEN